MKRKNNIKKFWITILTDIIVIALIFTNLEGSAGIIASIIVALSILVVIILSHKKTDFFISNKSDKTKKK